MFIFNRRAKKTSRPQRLLQRNIKGKLKNKEPEIGKGRDRYNPPKDVTLTLGPIDYFMDDEGEWHSGTQDHITDEGDDYELAATIRNFETRNEVLSTQNNMIRLRNEVLVHNVSEKRLEIERMKKELEDLRDLLSPSLSLSKS